MPRRKGVRFWHGLGFLITLGLGIMLLVAALLKAADPALFIEQIRGYKVLPSLAVFAAYAFLWVETIIGLMLILRVVPRPALLAFSALMLLFIGVTAWAWAHGNVSGCGCFGRMASRPPRDVILEDLAYLALAGLAFWTAPWIGRSRGRWAAYALVLPVFLASPWVAPRLPVDSFITGVRPGTNLEDLAAEDLKVPLGEGRLLVAFLGNNCPGCIRALPEMEKLGQSGGAPTVMGIFAGDRRAKRAWTLEHVPSFPVAQAPEKALRQYYRRLPVFLLLEEGKVRRVWWNRPPRPDEVLS